MANTVSKNDSLLPLFDQLKSILARYEPPLVSVRDERARYELEFDKDFHTKSGRTGKITKKHGLYFAGLIIQKHYVGLYFMPVYSHAKEFIGISDRLRKILKGKTCFYITTLDDGLDKEIIDMLNIGYKIYDKFDGTD